MRLRPPLLLKNFSSCANFLLLGRLATHASIPPSFPHQVASQHAISTLSPDLLSGIQTEDHVTDAFVVTHRAAGLFQGRVAPRLVQSFVKFQKTHRHIFRSFSCSPIKPRSDFLFSLFFKSGSLISHDRTRPHYVGRTRIPLRYTYASQSRLDPIVKGGKKRSKIKLTKIAKMASGLECNLFTLEYDCTDTLGPRCTGIFKANLTGADILPIQYTVQTYSTNLHQNRPK